MFANSLKPPAIASACRIVVGPCSCIVPGMRHLAHHVDLRRQRLDDDDGDRRVGDVLLERRRDRVAQLDRRVAGRLEVADERQRDLAVGPDLHRLRQLRVLVDLDAQLVAGAERGTRRSRAGACGAGFLSSLALADSGASVQTAAARAPRREYVMACVLLMACNLSSDRRTSGRRRASSRSAATGLTLQRIGVDGVGRIAGGADRDAQRASGTRSSRCATPGDR